MRRQRWYFFWPGSHTRFPACFTRTAYTLDHSQQMNVQRFRFGQTQTFNKSLLASSSVTHVFTSNANRNHVTSGFGLIGTGAQHSVVGVSGYRKTEMLPRYRWPGPQLLTCGLVIAASHRHRFYPHDQVRRRTTTSGEKGQAARQV